MIRRTIRNPAPIMFPSDLTQIPQSVNRNIYQNLQNLNTTIAANTASNTAIKTVTSSYQIVSTDRTILADATLGPISVTLPNAVTNIGSTFTVKRINSNGNLVTVNTLMSQTIDTDLTAVYGHNRTSADYRSDGSNWELV